MDLRGTIPLLTLLVLPTAAQAAIDPERLAGLKARNIGPAGMSGRLTSIDAVVAQPEIVYVGAATGGVWKSVNGGVTWTSLFDDQPVHAVGAVAVFQSNPDIVWVGTGEGNTRNSVSVGNGVYKSLDGGKNWRHLGLEKTERIYRILLDPRDPDVAYVCAPGQEWGESPERGVFKTQDGGQTWNKILYVDEKTGCGDLAMDPGNPGKLIAALWQFRRWPYFFESGGPGSGLHVTHDGGASWRKLQPEDGLPQGELGRIGLAIAPSDPSVVYALVEAEKSALVRSNDGGKTFKTVNDAVNVSPRPFYFGDLRVDPAWPERVYSVDYEIRVSDDGGKSFKTLPGASWAQIHGDHHALWIHPTDPERLYDANDGGFAESRDRGKTFRFVGNLPLAQFYHVAVDNDRPYNVYGGLQDNGSWRGPSAVWQHGGIRNYHWLEVGGGDGFDVQPDPRDSMIGYSLWQGGNLMRWNLRTGEQRIVKPADPEGGRLRFNWNAAIAIDPFAPDTIYLGSQFVHRSKDRGESWQTISPDLTSNNPEWQKQDDSGGLTPDVTAAENYTTIIALAPSALEQGLIWAGTDDGRLHLTRDGGASWTSLEKNIKGVPAHTWLPHVEASRHDPGTAFVVFDNHRRSDWTPYVYRTDDYGKTWRSLATPGLRGYCLAIAQDPVKKELLFLGSEFGLYVSLNGGDAWTPLHKTIPTTSVMDLAIQAREHDLVIGTHGRAIWILDDIRPLRALSETSLAEPLRLHEVAAAQQHWRRNEEGGFGFGASEFRGENRPYGAILTYSLNLPDLPLHDEEKERARKEKQRQDSRAAAPGKAADKKDEKQEEPKVEIRVADASGRTVRTFKGPAKLGLNRAVWDLRRDAFRELPRAADAPPREDDEPAGPELPPGRYSVTVRYQDHEANQGVEVLPDPRYDLKAEDYQRRWDAILEAGALYERAADAVWRIRHAREDVGVLQQKARQAAEAAGEKDQKKLAEAPLVKAGEKLKESLGKLEKSLWPNPDTAKGIPADTDALSQVQRTLWFLMSSFEPPPAAHAERLRQASARLDAFMGELSKLFDTEVAAFRKQAEQAQLGLLASPQP